MATLDYRFRIQPREDPDDIYPDTFVTFSTIPGDDCFILEAPTQGDGASFDPILGSFVLGTYTLKIVDAGASGSSTDGGAVSAFMSDADNRTLLLSQIGIVEFSEDEGSTWTIYLSAFVTRIRKLSPLVYEFSVGDSQRIDQGVTLFKEKAGSFDKMSCLIGGPVRGSFVYIADFGPWEMEVKGNYDDLVTQFHFVSGYVRSSSTDFGLGFATGGYEAASSGDYGTYEELKVNALAAPYRVQVPDFLSAEVSSQYPRLEARIEDMDGVLIGLFMVVNARDPDETLHAILSGGDLCVYWGANTVENPNTPGVNFPDQLALHVDVQIIVYALDVTETSPVHVFGHPVDIHARAYADAGIAYDADSVTATKTALGDTLGVTLRPTKSMSLAEFGTQFQGFFGYSVRQEGGKRYFFPTRIRDAAAPTLTLTAADLTDASPIIFDVDDSTIINQVTMSTERYHLWAPEKYGPDAVDTARPIDELVTVVDTATIRTTDDLVDNEQGVFGVHEQTFALQGTILIDESLAFFIDDITLVATSAYALSVARGAGSMFDRRQRGAMIGEIHCLRGGPGGLDAANLGDEITMEIPWQQNGNTIGGSRIVQITQRTETPIGPIFMVEDAGVDDQPGAGP